MNGVLIVRLLVVALSVALAVALIARGNVLIGVIIGALALSRLALFVMVRRRRKAFARRRPRQWGNDA
jgi:hypothetical protein